MSERWDVIIVGARCAGATLATLLARQGVRTLVLEASSRGTNMPLSTHLVQPPGMAVLDRIGIGPRVRAVTPASTRVRFSLDQASMATEFPLERAPYCVRRSTLDPWLQDCAEQASAELRFRHRVVDLVRTEGRVTGVVVHSPSGTSTLHADMVIGADGPHSTVAKLTEVEQYLVSDNTRAGYMAYYPAPAHWDADWDFMMEHRGIDLRYVFRCDGDLLVVVYMGERDAVTAWGADRRSKLDAAFAGSPTTHALTTGKQPVGASTGFLKGTFFYRRPVGPGFALIGDAGHFKDFVTGHGMTDAFLDAERMASAVLDGREEAYGLYWHQRDVETMPLHFDAIRQGRTDYNTPFMRGAIRHLGKTPALIERAQRTFHRELSPAEIIPTAAMARIVGSALLRGQFDVLPGFLRMGKTLGAEARELAQRERLLEAARSALAHAAPRTSARSAARAA